MPARFCARLGRGTPYKRKQHKEMKRKVDAEESSSDTLTHASAWASSSTSNDENEFNEAVEQLVSIFNFDPSTARRAVDAVGTDLTIAYNWIFDQELAEDKGGPVIPTDDCPHITAHVLISPADLQLGEACSFFDDDVESKRNHRKGDISDSCPSSENWICLECNATRCSRYVSGHSKEHWLFTREKARENGLKGEDTDCVGHCIAASVSDLSVWCYECDAYIRHPLLKPITDRLEFLKFGGDADEESPSQGDNFSEQETDNDIEHYDSSDAEDTIPRHPFLPTNLKDLAQFILSDKCKNIAVLAGAGMSRASGIPDFRSAGGMYETLRPELLTATEEHRNEMRMNPTVVFGRPLFLQNSLPCLELKRPFILGTMENKWKATIAHRFVELLHKKTGKLRRIYTQNIDGLEGQCSDLPSAKVIPVHGTMNRVKCELCQSPMNFVEFCHKVQSNIKDITGQDPHAPTVSTPIPCLNCGQATVKPDIILFHSPLPKEFFSSLIQDAPSIDLLFVIGTSLNVYPACELVRVVPQSALRVIINAEPVGQQLGVRYGDETVRDYFAQGMCEDVVLNLIDELEWMHDLHAHVDDIPQPSSIMVQERLRGTMKTL